MASAYDKASLVMLPNAYKDGKVYSVKPEDRSGDFTFTRSTAATRVNADGNIEKETGNLLLYSNTFSNSAWGKYDTSVTGGQSGYDGTSDASLLAIAGATGFQTLRQMISNSGAQTFSIYAKAGALNWMRINTGTSNTYFDIANGAVGADSSIGATIESAGNGYYRCSVPLNGGITFIFIYPATDNNNPNQSSGNIYIQDAQVEQGLVARDYIETTTSAVYGGITDNVPRLDYTDSSCPALLLEPLRTNIFLQSEYYNAYWNRTNSSVSDNQLESPEGFINASVLSVVSPAQAGINAFNTWSNNTTYSMSAFVKKKIGSYIGFGVYGNNLGDEWIKWNLDNGTSIASDLWTNADFEDFGNGWYRISATITTTSGNTSKSGFKLSLMTDVSYTSGNVGDETYIYGFQLEAGSYPTSYIPTYGSSVSRVTESNSVTGVADLIGQTEGAMFFEIDQPYTDGVRGAWAISDGSSSNRITMNTYGVNATTFTLGIAANYSGSSTKLASVITTYGLHKVLIQYSATILKLFVDGALADSVTTDGFGNYTNFYVGGNQTGVGNEIREIKQALLFPTALTDSECIALTTI